MGCTYAYIKLTLILLFEYAPIPKLSDHKYDSKNKRFTLANFC